MVSFPVIQFYGSEEKTLNGEIAIDYSALTTELINATTEKEVETLSRRFAFDFLPSSPSSMLRATAEDVRHARSIFLLALSLRGLLDNNECSIENVEELGFEVEYLNRLFDPEKDIDIQLFAPKQWEHYANECSATKETAEQVRFSICFEMQGSSTYLPFLNRAIDYEQWGLKVDPFAGVSSGVPNTTECFFLSSPCSPIGTEYQREQVRAMIDKLFTIHLFDVRTVSVDGGLEAQKSHSVLSSIWLSAMQRFTEGRAGRCAVCGKPFITARERGKIRKYCSGTCSKWAQRHPGETRQTKPTR